jgi:hypothetical protein
MRSDLHRICLVLAGLWLAWTATACVEDPAEEPGLGASRSLHEELLAEEVEALLPGDWLWDHAQPQAGELEMPALSILFLGHDAVTGDAAVLLELGDDAEQTQRQLQAARVHFDDTVATLHMSEDSGTWRVQSMSEDQLVLHDLQTDTRHFYLRAQ